MTSRARTLPLALAFACILTATLGVSADETPAPGQQVGQSLEVNENLTVPYLLALPTGYGEGAGKEWPVILFLHGRGESDGPLGIVAKWGPPRMAARGDDLPYIVVSPQCPKETNWGDPTQHEGVMAVLDKVLEDFDCDRTRVYLTGLSMGGYGSWSLAAKHPDRFAAVAPVCGGGDPATADKLVDVPVWAFHGDRDEAVPFERSAEMVEAIEKTGGKKVRFTSLEHVGHNSWSAAYATPELWSWFDRHTTARGEG